MHKYFTQSTILLFILVLLPGLAVALQWPSPSSRITSGYGWRIHPVQGIPRWHNGIDISTNGLCTPGVYDPKIRKNWVTLSH